MQFSSFLNKNVVPRLERGKNIHGAYLEYAFDVTSGLFPKKILLFFFFWGPTICGMFLRNIYNWMQKNYANHFFIFFFINWKKFYFRANFRLSFFDGFTRFGMSWKRFDYFWKMSVWLSVCMWQKFCGMCSSKINAQNFMKICALVLELQLPENFCLRQTNFFQK